MFHVRVEEVVSIVFFKVSSLILVRRSLCVVALFRLFESMNLGDNRFLDEFEIIHLNDLKDWFWGGAVLLLCGAEIC